MITYVLQLFCINSSSPIQNSQQISHDNHHLTEPVAMTTVTPSIINTSSSHTMSVIVPHPSPKKGVRGSFLDRPPKPIVSSTPPRSPAAQDMDDILTRSHGGQRSGRVGDMSPALSARRKLSLNSDMVHHIIIHEMFVQVFNAVEIFCLMLRS